MKKLYVNQVLDGSIYDRETEKHVAVHTYTVTKVVNSITPCISESLSAQDLNDYCESDDWQVDIK